MKIVVGLGNPGEEYRYTRHNVGFMVLDNFTRIVANETKWQFNAHANAEYAKIMVDEKKVELLKPKTFMNRSGKAVSYVLNKHSINLAELLIVHDDWGFALGTYKFSFGKGANRHNGVQSIIDALGTRNFWRLRVGIGRPKQTESTQEYVLSPFSTSDQKLLQTEITPPLLNDICLWIREKIR